MRAFLISITVLTVTAGAAFAADQIPAMPQGGPILLVGGDVFTVSGDVIAGGEVLLVEGKIAAVGKTVKAPAGATRVDVKGKRVYPGLLAAGNDLGLTEVRSVPGSVDTVEVGTINPNARAEVAINPDSELIPVARANGILLNLTIPSGGLLTGSSAVIQLDGWTWEDMTVRAPVALHLNWPGMRQRARRVQNAPEQPQPSRDEQLESLEKAFADARAYMDAKRAGPVPHDARWEAMIPLLEGKVPLVVHADGLAPIQAAVAFAARQKVRLIIHGGYDAGLCVALLRKHDVAVIINGVQRLPQRVDAAYDEPFTLAHRLHQAGVKFCIAQMNRFGASDVRNLPYHAATAAAHGLPADEALKAITLYPAQILGVAGRVGSIEAGKDATLIVTDGDILETRTSVEKAFVQGREIDLSSKHTQLWKKYREKYRRQGNGKAVADDRR